jgi:glucose 1-dehydrogenase
MDIREHTKIFRSRPAGQKVAGQKIASQKLAGQKALVTGANSGIGRAVAIALAEAGASVVVNYVAGENEAHEVADLIASRGGRAMALRADVSSEAQVAEMFEEACAIYGTLDIVVANAGLQRDAPFEEMTLRDWNAVINVNLTGQFLCAREAVREFLRRGPRPDVSCALGKIICMSSVHEIIPWAGHANYAASKGGVMMLMKSIAQELAPRGIRVNGIAPGATRTPINTEAWSTPEAYEALMRLVPYKRIGEPDDIARAAVWLASDDSDYVNGVTLFVDGGMTLYPEFASGG